jgi:hypothetical protein
LKNALEVKLAKEGEVSILRKNMEKVRVSAMISVVSLIPLFLDVSKSCRSASPDKI